MKTNNAHLLRSTSEGTYGPQGVTVVRRIEVDDGHLAVLDLFNKLHLQTVMQSSQYVK